MPPRIPGQDEILYVLSGGLNVAFNGSRGDAAEGALVYCPAGTAFSWSARTDARILVFHLPGGFDQALALEGDGADRLMAMLKAGGTQFLADQV